MTVVIVIRYLTVSSDYIICYDQNLNTNKGGIGRARMKLFLACSLKETNSNFWKGPGGCPIFDSENTIEILFAANYLIPHSTVLTATPPPRNHTLLLI